MWKQVTLRKMHRNLESEREESTNAAPGRVLGKFDETDMKEVDTLMKQFENVSFFLSDAGDDYVPRWT